MEPLSEEDYGAIEGAVMETARGRWFLAEYTRRNRNADTTAVLEAIGRLEHSVGSGKAAGHAERLHFDLIDMANAIARTKAEIAAIKPEGESGRIGDATGELDAIVKATETATGDILAAAEHLQEIAWTMREAGVQTGACDIIDQRATDIYTACSFQDITGQRTQKVIHVLRYLEDRLNSMIAIWGSEAPVPAPPPPLRGSADAFLNGPALPGQGLVQSDVDAMWAAVEPPPIMSALPAARTTADLPPPLTIAAVLPPLSLPVAPAVSAEPAPLPGMAPDASQREPAVLRESAAAPAASEPAGPSQVPAVPAPLPVAASALQLSPAAEQLAVPPGTGMESPFSPPVRPKPRPRAGEPAPERRTPPRNAVVTLADIEALPFEERAALFS